MWSNPGQGRIIVPCSDLEKPKCYKVVNCIHGNLTAYNLSALLGSDKSCSLAKLKIIIEKRWNE